MIDLAVRRFNAFARLQSDLAEAQGKLAERETIDKAKRILMHSKRVTEPEAGAGTGTGDGETGPLPALQARRLRIVDALRKN